MNFYIYIGLFSAVMYFMYVRNPKKRNSYILYILCLAFGVFMYKQFWQSTISSKSNEIELSVSSDIMTLPYPNSSISSNN